MFQNSFVPEIQQRRFVSQLNNPNFKSIKFERFRNDSGSNHFTLSPQRWIGETDAIGLVPKSGRYGGTFAHKDIAFEFAS
nr:KilA-N domain-containing protein [Sphingobacterium multivorum]